MPAACSPPAPQTRRGGRSRASAEGAAHQLDAESGGPPGGVAQRVAHVFVHRRAVGYGGAISLYSLADHRVDVRMLPAEPRADDLGIRETGELVEVLLCRKRLAVLGEELHEDLAEDRLVVRERPVEVEHDAADHRICDSQTTVVRSPRKTSRECSTGCPAAEYAVRSTSITGAPGSIPSAAASTGCASAGSSRSCARTGTVS